MNRAALGLFAAFACVTLANPALAQEPPPAPPVAVDPQPKPPPFPAPAPPAPPTAPPGYAPPSYAPPGYAAPPPVVVVAPQPAARPVDRPETSLWYGWQTLIAVAPFDIAMFAGIAKYGDRGAQETFMTGFVGRNVAPAIVHAFHRRPGMAFGSLGLHAAATATGVAIGYAIGIAVQEACPARAPCRNGFRDLPPGPEYGAIAGSMVGTLLDVIILARRPRSSWSSSQTGSAVMVAPFATASSGGIAAGGVF